jgi:hypoxanthine phosphoribosyltransferase
LIVAMMRGGEPMAFGVNEVFPRAMFLHAKGPEDIRKHLGLSRTILLVDSVVNTGESVRQFVEYIRRFNPTIHIVLVAGVIQSQCMDSGGTLDEFISTTKT